MFPKFSCRNVRGKNVLSTTCILVLLFQPCLSRDKKSCAQISVERKHNKPGFHRDLVTFVEWDIPSNFDDDSNKLDCQLLLVEHFPSGIYIDPDQIKNKVQFGGPEVLTTETINVESLAHHGSSHKIFVFPKIATDYRLGTMSANITIPVHLRYHQATIGTKFASVSLSSPKIFGKCNGVTSPALQCGTPLVKAPCNAKGLSSCDWILLNSANKDMLQSDMALVFHVPVGQIEHSWPIIALTVLSSMAGCSLILWNSLAIT